MAQTPGTVNLRMNFDPAQIRSLIRMGVIGDVLREADRAERKHGPQSHPNGTGRGYSGDLLIDLDRFGADAAANIADIARDRCEHYSRERALEWEQILTEEFFEAIEAEDDQALAAELEQVAAVCVSWITDIRMRNQEDR